MKATALNIKNMKEAYVNNCEGEQTVLEEIWYTYYEMSWLGFISEDLWDKFNDECGGWIIKGDYLIDTDDHNKIIFDFDNGNRGNGEYQEYKAS